MAAFDKASGLKDVASGLNGVVMQGLDEKGRVKESPSVTEPVKLRMDSWNTDFEAVRPPIFFLFFISLTILFSR